jgi:hypothetical protein
MSRFDEKSEQAREAALRRWGRDMPTQSERNADAMPTQSERNNDKKMGGIITKIGSNNADAMPTQSERNASKVKYNRVYKSKVNNIIELPDFLDKSLWDDFMEMRTKKRIPNTERAKQLLINRLIEFHSDGQDANKIIEQSIMRGWTGVFPIKDSSGEKHGTYQGNNQNYGNARRDNTQGDKPRDYTGGKYGHMVKS